VLLLMMMHLLFLKIHPTYLQLHSQQLLTHQQQLVFPKSFSRGLQPLAPLVLELQVRLGRASVVQVSLILELKVLAQKAEQGRVWRPLLSVEECLLWAPHSTSTAVELRIYLIPRALNQGKQHQGLCVA